MKLLLVAFVLMPLLGLVVWGVSLYFGCRRLWGYQDAPLPAPEENHRGYW